MAKRAQLVPPRDFTAFFYLVLLESDDLDDTLSDEELLERAQSILGPRLAKQLSSDSAHCSVPSGILLFRSDSSMIAIV
jgi:hypothetical protein